MLKHIVLLQWKEGTEPAAIERFTAGLRDLAASIDEIRSYQFGPDAGLQDNRYDYVLVAEFDDVDSYQRYVVHPEHQAFCSAMQHPFLSASSPTSSIVSAADRYRLRRSYPGDASNVDHDLWRQPFTLCSQGSPGAGNQAARL